MKSNTVQVISSMATRQLLGDLVKAYRWVAPECDIQVESVGGVDAAKRVRAGEAFDVVALASGALAELEAAGHVRAGSRVDIVRSGVAAAVREGAPVPAMQSEAQLKESVLAARTLGYSTGPSGVQLAKLFERWGIADAVNAKIVQAPPGVPVAKLIAQGEVELGFQQLSELMGVPGIRIVGPLPDAVQIVTVFSAAIATTAREPLAAAAWLQYLASPQTAAIKEHNGMEPAT